MRKIFLKWILCIIAFIAIFLLILYTDFNLNIKAEENIENSRFEKKDGIFFAHEIIRYYSNISVYPFDPNATRLSVGVNADKSYIGFGFIQQSYSSKRNLEFFNSKPKPYKIRLYSNGNISQFIKFEKRDFLIFPGEFTIVPVEAFTKLETTPGNYTGEIDVVISIPKNKISEIFQRLI